MSNQYALIFAPLVAFSLTACATTPAKKPTKTDTATRAIVIDPADSNAIRKEFFEDFGEGASKAEILISYNRIASVCADQTESFGKTPIPTSLTDLIGWGVEKVVGFFFDRLSRSVKAELKKYSHSFDENAFLVGAGADENDRTFSLYADLSGQIASSSPRLAVKCFRLMKYKQEKQPNNVGQKSESKKRLAMDFVGLMEIDPKDPLELKIRPVRLVYKIPEAKSQPKSINKNGQSITETKIGIGVSAKMHGRWREDNQIKYSDELFDVQFLTDSITLEELSAKGRVEKWYGPKDKKYEGKSVTLPPSSKVGGEYFLPNQMSLTLSVIESGAAPNYLKALDEFLNENKDELEKESNAKLKEIITELGKGEK